MNTRPLVVCLLALSIAAVSCSDVDHPSAPGVFSPLAQADTTTNDCLNSFLDELSSTLSQWEAGLEEELEEDLLATPVSFAGDVSAYLSELPPLLGEWEDSLETARGTDFLESTPAFEGDVNTYLASLSPSLNAWEDSLEAWRGADFLPTAPVFTPDTTAPTITCPADTLIGCSGPEGVAVSFEVAVFDSCDSNPVVECTPASGSTFAVGTTTVTCTATDADGNSSECSFTVTVEVDTTPPEITCPGDVTLECTGDGMASYEFTATATDSCDSDPDVVCDPPSGSSFPLGTTTVTCTATDDAGNSSECSFTVTVEDTQPPVIEELSIHPTQAWPPNHKMVDIEVQVTATDVCDSEVTCWVGEVTSNESVNGRGDGNTEPDWEITGPLEVSLRAERQGGGSGRVYSMVVMCSDSSGNTAQEAVEFRVPHDRRSE